MSGGRDIGGGVCPKRGCPNLNPCPTHPPRQPWEQSTRASRLPRDWAKTRARILNRDHGVCHVCGQPGANEVDHIEPGDDHTDANLAAIHGRGTPQNCHARKSSAEGRAARAHLDELNGRRPRPRS